ncbi:MAG: DNA primase [Actinomycetota bacterium]
MGLIRDEDIEAVRERADLVEIISQHVQLKKAGRLFKGLCPFHQEKTPSFFVDPDKQLYHCFACGEGGNAYTFLMKMENLEFPEAVRTLAGRVGYSLKFEETSAEKKALLSKQARLYNLNLLTQRFYQQILQAPEGKKALTYLSNRGYTPETIKTFMLGYAPDKWDALLTYALKNGYKKEELLAAGLVIKSQQESGRVFDRFRGRIIFPILDIQGRAIGFGGRVLGEEMPKYMNSPETPIYHKSRVLYALNWARSEVTIKEEAIIVEGYTDVISLHQHGIRNAVATLGTALTAEHLRLISRFARRVTLVFDADVAGKMAAERGLAFVPEFYLSSEYRTILDLVEKKELDMMVAVLPKGSDPADFVSKQGQADFEKLVSGASPLVDFCISSVLASHNLSIISERQRAASQIVDIIARLPSPVAQEAYLKTSAEKLAVSYESLMAEFNRKAQARGRLGQRGFESRGKGAVESSVSSRKDPGERVEREVLQVILQFGEFSENFLGKLTGEHFTSPIYKNLFLTLKDEFDREGKIDSKKLPESIGNEEVKRAAIELSINPLVSVEKEKYAHEILDRIKEFEIRRRINNIKEELRKINPQKEPEKYDSLFEKLLGLEASRRELLLSERREGR